MVAILCCWLQHEHENVIAFLREENRVLKAQLAGQRLRLDDLCLLKSRNEDGTLSFEASNPRVNPRGTPSRSRDRGHSQYITATQTC
jgi:hypothetical protein